jgi:hypothetical protein
MGESDVQVSKSVHETLYGPDSAFAVLQSIEEKLLPKHSLPLEVFVQEVEELYSVALEDQTALCKVGLDPAILRELPDRIRLCREAMTRCNLCRDTTSTARTELLKQRERIAEFTRELVKVLRFVNREEPELLRKVRTHYKRRTMPNRTQSFLELVIFAKEQSAQLQAVGFDVQRLLGLEAEGIRLRELEIQSFGYSGERMEFRILRDRAYVYLKSSVDTIRAHGKFVYGDDPEKFQLYTSRYRRKQKQRARPGKLTPPAASEPSKDEVADGRD